ncbi:MAG: hypothetical protein IJZ68_14005 [Bacteroidaceae bacterium]|nr:hypothetical protein [Bacteroidaceae bacterium]
MVNSINGGIVMSDEIYRLNCHLPKEFGDKIAQLADRTGQSKVAIVTQALNNYFDTLEVQAAIIDRLKTDPSYVAKLTKLMEGEA